MEELDQILQDYVATANSGKYGSWDEINSKFPELSDYPPEILQDYVATANSGKYESWEEINSKFPEFSASVGGDSVGKSEQMESTSDSEVIESVTEETITDGGSELSETQEKFRFKPESDGVDRYTQVGLPTLKQEVDSLTSRKDNINKELADLKGDTHLAPVGYGRQGIGKMAEVPKNPEKIRTLEQELNQLNKVLSKKEEDKAKVDVRYSAEMLGGDADKLVEMVEKERSLESTAGDFMDRVENWWLRGGLAQGLGFDVEKSESELKQEEKYRLENEINKEIENSQNELSERIATFEEAAKNFNKFDLGAEIDALQQTTASEEEFEKQSQDLINRYTEEAATLQKEQEVLRANAENYINSLGDIALINQYDDLSMLESGVKSAANEIIKTPRQLAGLVKSLSVLSYIQPQAFLYEDYAEKAQEAYLESVDPLTGLLTDVSDRNLLRVDTEEEMANFVGTTAAQLAKIIPASVAAPAAGMAVTAGMSFDEMYDMARNTEGVTEEEAVNLGAAYLPFGMALEYVGARTGINMATKKAIQQSVFKMVKDKGIMGLNKKALTEQINDYAKKEFGRNIIKEFIEEGVTESLQTSTQEIIKWAKNTKEGKEVFEVGGEQFVQDLWKSALYGGMAGAGTATVIGAVSGSGRTAMDDYKETIMNSGAFNQLVQRTNTDKTLTEEQKQTILSTLDRDRQTFEDVERATDDKVKQRQLLDLVSQKKKLEETKPEDKVLAERHQESINAIDERIRKVLGTDEESKTEGESKQEQTKETKATEEVQVPDVSVQEETVTETATLSNKRETSKPLARTLKIEDGTTQDINVGEDKVGEVTTETDGDKVRVRRVDITEENRGKGHAKQVYRDLQAEAQKEGKTLASDKVQTNEEAQRVWDGLVESGEAKKLDDGTYEMTEQVSEQTQKPDTDTLQQVQGEATESVLRDGRVEEASTQEETKQAPQEEKVETVLDVKKKSAITEEAESKLTGIMNAAMPNKKKAMDSELAGLSTTDKEIFEKGKRMVDSGEVNPAAILDEVKVKRRPLTPDETVAIIYYKALKQKEIDILADKLNDLDPNSTDARFVKAELQALQRTVDEINAAAIIAGKVQAQAFRLRQLLIDRDEFTLSYQEKIYKIKNNVDNVPEHVVEELKAQVEEYKRVAKEQAELIKKQQKENEILKVRPEHKDKPVYTKVERDDLIRKLRSAKAIKSVKDMSKLSSDPTAPFKAVWDGAIEIAVAAIKAEQSVNNAIRAAVAHIKDSDWYKGLSKDGKKKAEKMAAEALQDAIKKSSKAKVILPSRDEDGNLNIPNSFISSVIKAGFTDVKAANKEIQRILKEDLEIDATEQEVLTAISNYGKTSKQQLTDLQKKVNELKRVDRLLAALNDVRSGKRPKKTGKKRAVPTDTERYLMQQINELMKDLPLDTKQSEELYKTALEKIHKRLDNTIADLDRQIETGERPAGKKKVPLDADAIEKKRIIEELKKLRDEKLGKEGLTYAQRVRIVEAGLERAIQTKEDKIKRGDFSTPSKDRVESPKITKLREKKAKIDARYNELYAKSAEGLAKAEQRELARLEREKAKIQQQIVNGVKKKTKEDIKKEKSPAIKRAKAELEALKATLRDTDSYKKAAQEQRIRNAIKAKDRAIAEYKRRIAEKDYAPKQKIKTTSEKIREKDLELARMKEQFIIAQERWKLEQRTRPEVFADMVWDLFTLPRTLMASLDLSAPFRQGVILTLSHPTKSWQAWGEMFKQMWSKERYDKWLANLDSDEQYQFASSMGLSITKQTAQITAREEMFMNRLASNLLNFTGRDGKKYGWGGLIDSTSRAYSAYLNVLRMNVFNSLSDNLRENGVDPETAEGAKAYQQLAGFINNTTGRGKLPQRIENLEGGLNQFFFAPRYVISRFGVLNPWNYIKAYRTNRQLGHMMTGTMLKFMASSLLIMGLARLGGAEVEDDPRSADWGKIKIGDLRLDMMGGLLQPARLLYVLMVGETKSSTSGKITELDTGEPFSRTRKDVIGSFFRSKLSPSASLGMDWLSHPKDPEVRQPDLPLLGEMSWEAKTRFENVIGEKMTAEEKALSNMIPLFIQDINQIAREEGAGMAVGAAIPALFGVGASYYTPRGSSYTSADFKAPENIFEDVDVTKPEFDDWYEDMDLDLDLEDI